MVSHVRFECLYISLPSPAKQQREMTELYVFYGVRTAMANFSCLPFKLNTVITYFIAQARPIGVLNTFTYLRH